MDLQSYRAANERYRALVEDELRRLLSDEGAEIYPKLREAMAYSLEAGGKRLRPCLLLAVCEMLGGDVLEALPMACALEMIHTYSLIHDDMPGMDNDDMRRGRPSNHKVFGEGIALLAGDALLSFAFEIMLGICIRKHSEGFMLAAREIVVMSGAKGMLTGQAADKENEDSHEASESILGYIHRHKTADMLEAAVIAGAFCADADDRTISALKVYSEKIGLLFQITDDILDVTGDQAKVGKTLGKDRAEGKLTYVSLLGLEGARREAERAAEDAKASLNTVDNSDHLVCVIDDMISRDK